MDNYQILIDTWEGQLDIDEDVLKANGVVGMFIRLNDMNGGHHMDSNFTVQWEQAINFCRAPYFVYNPWVSGSVNFMWLNENCPQTKSVAIDIEVKYPGYAPATYANEVRIFLLLAMKNWNVVIYTGEWFLPYLSIWQTNFDYWWSEYPFAFYPDQPITISWDELREKLKAFNLPLNANKIPGHLKFWQFSGDRLILPGNPKPIDVNVFYGSLQELQDYMGFTGSDSPPPPKPEPDPVPNEPVPDPKLWNGVVRGGIRLTVRTFPKVDYSTKTDARLTGGESIYGNLWIGNGYVWMKITSSIRAELIGQWVAVRSVDETDQFITLHEAEVFEPGSMNLYRLLGDENLALYHYCSRTIGKDWTGFKCTPSVMRFEKTPRYPGSDYRVNITPLDSAIHALNGNNKKKVNYLYGKRTALYNGTGYPKQQYLTMQGNVVNVLSIEGKFARFETLKPSSSVSGMTHESHPHFVHRFDLVCYDKRKSPSTYHKPNTPQGIIDYFLVTNEGYGYMPLEWLKKV